VREMIMPEFDDYRFLERRLCSRCKRIYVKGTPLYAETLYRETVGLEPRTAEEVAQDYGVPVEAVLEAISYCERNADLLRKERDEELARLREYEKEHPPVLPPGFQPQE
jgi:hypothetical protein